MKKHPYTWAGLSTFIDSAFEEIIASGADIVISIGENQLRIPTTPESFESLELMLNETLTIWEADYK